MKRFVTLIIAILIFIMPSFSKDMPSVTITAPKNATIINDTGKTIAVVNTIGEKNEIDWGSFVPIYNKTYLNFTDTDGDIAILFDVNIENGSCKSVWTHIKINSNGQTIIRFYIDATNEKPCYIIYRNNGYVETH